MLKMNKSRNVTRRECNIWNTNTQQCCFKDVKTTRGRTQVCRRDVIITDWSQSDGQSTRQETMKNTYILQWITDVGIYIYEA